MRIVILLFSALFLAGCSTTPEQKEDPIWYGTGTVVHKIAYSDCYHLKIYDEKNVEHAMCASEHVWNDALEGHKITITEEYH